MVVQRVGAFCFKISAGDTTLALNPPGSRSAFKVPKFGADIVLVPVSHEDWDGVETAAHGGKEPFVVSGPGAYEIGDVRISGYATPADYDDVKSDVGNTAYVIEMDGIRVLSLGAIAGAKLPGDARADVDDIGIVLVPVGDGTLGPKEAHELVTSIEPSAIIPYAVGRKGEEELRAFLKAEGEGGAKPQERFTVRARELAALDGDVVLLS